MGEAWFMGLERRMYTELEEPDAIRKMDLVDISEVLDEITSGTKVFGHSPEWDDWFKYLLPDLIERSAETLWFDKTLFQPIVSAFMAVNWNGIEEHYSGFRDDVLTSLSMTMMHPTFWSTDETPPRPTFLDLQEDGVGDLKLFWGFGIADSSISAALFFCMKYLRPDEIPDWVESVVNISHPLWQGNLMTWFVGALEPLSHGSLLAKDIEASGRDKLEWLNSHLLTSPSHADPSVYPELNREEDFLPGENVNLVYDYLRFYYSEQKLLDLADVFS